MKRVQRYFIWKRDWWRSRKSHGLDVTSPGVKAGRESYAERQAEMASSIGMAPAAPAMWDMAMSPTAPMLFCTASGALAEIFGSVCRTNAQCGS